MFYVWRNGPSFHEKPSLPPITIHAGPVHASGALPANMVSVIEEYYLPDVEDRKFSALAIPKKDVQKATTEKKPRTQVNVPRLQQAVDQELLDDNDGGLTPIEDMDELEDEPLPIETPHIIPPAPQILKQTRPVRDSIKDMDELEDAVIPTEIQPDAPASFHGK